MTDDWRVVLDRYLAGECSPEEAAIVQQSLAADPDRAAWAALLEQARDRSGRVASGTDARAALDRVRARIAQAPTSARAESFARRDIGPPRLAGASRHLRPREVGKRAAQVARGAAIAVLPIVIGTIVWQAKVGRDRAGLREYRTNAGERATVTLPDGSQFTLAPASQLRVPLDYGAGNHTVLLDGEAFFRVMHDTTHPFRVRTKGFVATDVGTEFDVRTYRSDPASQVAVRGGEVSLRRCVGSVRGDRTTMRCDGLSGAVSLRSGDVATMGDAGTSVVHRADIDALTAWTSGELSFRSVPIGDVARGLARWYDLDVDVSDPVLAGREITFAVRNQAQDAVFAALALLVDAHVRRDGRRVTFYASQRGR